jgi:hypothetical protein
MDAATVRGLVLALMLVAPMLVRGQAWLPDEKTLGVSVVHNDVTNNQHYLANGDANDVGHTRVLSETFSLTYSPSDRWLLSASIPYVHARYHGEFPHRGTSIDDGQYRGTFTDLRLEAHYQVLETPFAFAPFVGLIIPTHRYAALGHAAPGRDLREQWLGFYVGKSLDEWLPRTYVQLRYNFAFVEKKVGVSHNRSNLDLEVGYFFNPRWSVRALAGWQRTHGGIDLPVPPGTYYYPYHDQLGGERYFQVGGGVAWAFGESSNVHLLYKRSLSGANGHRLNNGFTVGFAHAFTLGF